MAEPIKNLPEFREHGFDSKFEPLSPTDIATPSAADARYTDLIERILDRKVKGMVVLDFGCGRGGFVAVLRENGATAFGVDVDHRFIQNGALLEERYSDRWPILSLLDSDGRSVFPEACFDLIVSDQVLEHVADLPRVAREISRLLKPGGGMVHKFPARRRLVEPHYQLPFVHWMKGPAQRRWTIRALLAIGLAKKFFPDLSLEERTDIILAYSFDETFYRSSQSVLGDFANAGISASYSQGMSHYVRRRFGGFLPDSAFDFAGRLVSAFQTSVLVGRKL